VRDADVRPHPVVEVSGARYPAGVRRCHADLEQFVRRRALTRARLRRVDRALAAWDAWDQARTLPAEQRPAVSEPGPLYRPALESLHQVLVDTLGELEQAWQRRN